MNTEVSAPQRVMATPRFRSTTAGATLSVRRMNLMRVGYAVMVVGLAATKWPVMPNAASLPVYEGVVAAMLTAMSLLAFLGLRYPVKLLPLLIFESAWKLIWLGAVALPNLVAGDLNPDMESLLFSISFIVVILAVTPWDLAWKQFVRLPGDRWR